MEREKNTKAVTLSRKLLHVLVMLHDLVLCFALPCIFFLLLQVKKHLLCLNKSTLLWSTPEKKILFLILATFIDECVKLNTREYFRQKLFLSLVLKADNFMFPCMLPFSELASAESQDFIPCCHSNRFQMPKRNMDYGIWHMAYFHLSSALSSMARYFKNITHTL